MRSLPALILLTTLAACSSSGPPPCGGVLNPCPDRDRGGGIGHGNGSSSGGGNGSSSDGGAGDSVTPGGGGSSSDIKCESDGDTCVCNHNPDTAENTPTCSTAGVGSPGLCCADSAWPSSDECVCATVQCSQDGLGDCSCGFGTNGSPVSSCPKPDNGVCCVSEGAFGSEICLCTEGSLGCGEGQSEVDSCSTGAISCTGSSREVSACK